MILLFLILIGILLILIGIWKRKATYGKVFIGLGALLIGIFFFGPFGIFYSCEKYSNDLRNVLQKINKPCENSDDCKLISYYPCKPYCINKDVDLSAFYSLKKKRPWSCPLHECIAPEVKWRCACENNTCAVEEKEVIEEKVEDETANWKTYKNEEYKFSLKFPPSWEGYKTKKRILKWGGFGTSDSIDFGFPVQESLFNISIHAKTQWNNIISGEGPHPTHIAENEKFVFAYATAQDAANDEIVERMKEIKDIISTFRFLE